MPRLKKVEKEIADAKVQEIYTTLEGKMGKVINIFKGMGNSSVGLNTYLAMGANLAQAKLTAKERETIALTLAEYNECQYCLAAHTAIGAGAGIDEETNKAIRQRKVTDPKLQAIVDWTIAVLDTKGYVSNEQISAFKNAGYGDEEIVESVAVIAQNIFTNYFNHINDTEVDFPAAPEL